MRSMTMPYRALLAVGLILGTCATSCDRQATSEGAGSSDLTRAELSGDEFTDSTREPIDVAEPLGGDRFRMIPAPMQFSAERLEDGTPVFVGSAVDYVVLGTTTPDGARVHWCAPGAVFVDDERSPLYDPYGRALRGEGPGLVAYGWDSLERLDDPELGIRDVIRVRDASPRRMEGEAVPSNASHECDDDAELIG